MAQAGWMSGSGTTERRSEFGMNVDGNSPSGHGGHGSHTVAPRPIPSAPSDLNRWDLAELLNPSSNPPSARDRKMSLDLQPQHLYPPSDLDHHHLPPPHHQFDHHDPIDPPDHPNYDLFPNSTSPTSFQSQRYRTNASSSSSLGPNYSLNPDGLYSHSSFGDSVPSFGNSNSNPYDLISSLPSSYSSGKVSPLTPSDPVGGLHHQFPPKDFSPQNYPDDRRLPHVSPSGYPPDIMEEYSIGNMNGGLPFPPSALQHYPGRFPPESRFNHSGPPTTVPSHGPPSHGSDILRGIAPQATHGVPGYDDMPHYMGSNPHQDMHRMAVVDETLARMKLQGHSIMGASNDLQTFIRQVEVDLFFS